MLTEIYESKRDKTYRYNLDRDIDKVRYIAREQFAFPGGYELIGITVDGGLLCSQCIRDNYKLILQSTYDGHETQWAVNHICTESELENTHCDNCYKAIGYQNEVNQ